MQKIGRIVFGVVMILSLFIQLQSQAQSKKFFIITGKIIPEAESTGNGTIEITKNGKETSTIDIPKNGRFRFELEFFNEFSLTFKYPGHFNKIINVSTEIPQEVWQRDNDFPPFPMIVQLAKEFEGIDKSFALKPSGRIFYGKDIDNFEKESYISDLQFTDQIATAKTQANQVEKEAASISKENAQDLAAKQRDFDQLIKEADANYQRGEYQMALMKYLEARKLFPDKAYPNDRVAELQDLVKALEITEKQKTELEQKYKSAIAKANGFFEQKSYKEARPIYQEALQYKPGDVFSNGRINEIDQLLALLEKQNQFKDLIANADKNYKSKKYDEAITLYNQAKQLLPEDQYPQNQIDLITQEKQQQAQLDQLEKDFNQSIQTANTLAQQKDYLQALNSYKKALGLKPDSQIAKDKIAETELAIVAVENDKKYLQAIQLADQALAKNDLQSAKMQYQEAMKIKSEAYPKTKLAEIAASESKEIDFNNLLAKAEKASTDNNFDEAINFFTEALKLKPSDAAVKKRIEDIQNLKNKELAEKEYADLIAQADQNFNNNQFDEAISTYNKALQIKKSETYPKDQLKKIDSYQSLLKKADKSFMAKDYPESILLFNNILEVKPKDNYAAGKIDEIQKIQLEQKQLEEKAKAELLAYNEVIKTADQLFSAQSYPDALSKYKDALAMKSSEAYPKKRITEIETILDKAEKEKARIEKEYQTAIAQADNSFGLKDYNGSLASYNTALALKPNDSYSTSKIAEIQKIQLQLEEKAKAELLAYNEAIKAADQLFSAQSYPDALSKYKDALAMKSSEAYPKKRITEIETILDKAEKEKARIEKEYQTAIAQADNSFELKDYNGSLASYNSALALKPNDSYSTSKIAEIQKIQLQLEEKAKAELLAYNEAIKAADQLFSAQSYPDALSKYKDALAMKSSEAYPQKRITEIETILDKAEKEKARIEKEYQTAIAQADNSFGLKDYNGSLASYNTALALKPNDSYSTSKIAEIQKIQLQLEEKAKAELLAYNEAIKAADQLFSAQSYPDALSKYKDALAMKSSEAYPQKRITEIETILDKAEKEKARIEKEYQTAIAQADNSFGLKDYNGSVASYNTALALKPNDSYSTSKIAEIQKIQLDLKLLEEKNKAELLAYDKVIKVADQLFTAQNYAESLNKYKEALAIKTAEAYPQKKITEIESILDGIEKEKTRIENEYKAAIAQADKLLEKQDYANAQAQYRKALAIKVDQVYPKDQIRKIDETLAENRRREEEKQKQELEKQNLAFNQAMASADKSFSENDLDMAKTGYETALSIKPNDQVAKQKYGQTEAKIAQLAKNTQAYNKAITEANSRLTAKQYPEAREKYMEALQYLPDSDYPKRQVAKIDELLAQQEAEAKTRRDFDLAIVEGESLFKTKDLMKAKDAFMKAYNLIPSEVVPPKRISEINDLIAQQERNDAAQKATLEAYQKAIQRADNHFGNKEYNSAQLAYSEALLIIPNEKYPQDQLDLIVKLLKEQNEQNYKTAIAKADNSFNTNQLDDATTNYQEALKYKKDDQYATQRITEIEKKKADIEAENNRMKQFEGQYKALIADADNDFKNKSYAIAKEKYQKALTLKPTDVYPKDQIAKIDELIYALQKADEKDKQYAQLIQEAQDAFQANKLKDARTLYQKGYNLKPFEPLPPMRIAEIDRLLAQQDEVAKLAAMEKAQRLAKEKADREQYNNAVAAGDKEFAEKKYIPAKIHYTDALTALPNEQYPRDQIAKIDELMAQEALDKMVASQKAQQDSMQNAKNTLFERAMSSAKEHEQNNRFEQAIQKYNDAISIKPDQRSVIQKYISDIQDKMQLLAKQDAEYKRLIKLADEYFTDSKLNEALTEYQNALKVKSEEEYPKNQIKEIQSQLAAREQSYTNAIAKADKAYDASDWVTAKTGYTEALSVKPNEAYPLNRLKDVNQKIADANLAALSNSATNKAYAEAMEKAEKALKDDQLTSAKMQFQMAQSIKPDEKLPAQRIKEIDVLIDQRNKDRLAATQRELDEKYRQALSIADNSYHEKSYSIAKLQYQQASLIKPDESYPKTQMALMDKLMNEAKPVETYVINLPEDKPVKPAAKPIYNPQESAQATESRAQMYNTITDYDQAIKKADDLFGVKDYTVARFYYYKASDIKPAEEYPKKQVDLIRKLIDSQLSAGDLSEYDKAINDADKAFASKNYQIAKFFYYKALDIKSWEQYPKDRINEILALTNSRLSEKEEKEYRDIIAKADEAYFNKDMAISRFYYNKALAMKKDENYPRIKLKDIQKLIDQDALDQANEQYQNLIDQGDQALQLKNYSIARFNYNKALTMRPNEKYPKDQLKKLKEALQN